MHYRGPSSVISTVSVLVTGFIRDVRFRAILDSGWCVTLCDKLLKSGVMRYPKARISWGVPEHFGGERLCDEAARRHDGPWVARRDWRRGRPRRGMVHPVMLCAHMVEPRSAVIWCDRSYQAPRRWKAAAQRDKTQRNALVSPYSL